MVGPGPSGYHHGPIARAQVPDDWPLVRSLLHHPVTREVHASAP
jgi:hypothetical protein